MRRTSIPCMKRTGGYVFWRQSTLAEVENARKNYLLQERPFPLAEITRRMIRTRNRYQATEDFHEKNLLRGEYKFFSGKVCDLRGASTADLVSFLESGSFFGFWDTQQIERVLEQLRLQLGDLEPNELVHLMKLLPGLRKHSSAAYEEVAAALVEHVDGISDEDCIALLDACSVEDPPILIHNLLRAIEEAPLTPLQFVSVIGALSVLPQETQAVYDRLKHHAEVSVLDALPSLSVAQISAVADALHSMGSSELGISDPLPEATARRLQGEFLKRLTECDPHSLAMMFYACGSVQFALAAEDRVLFFATDFEPLELFAVVSWYLEALAAMGHAAAGAGPKEAAAVAQRRGPIVSVLNDLLDVLVTHLEAGDSYFTPQTVVSLLGVMGETAAFAHGVPRFNIVAQELCSKCIKFVDVLPAHSLTELLIASDNLGPRALDAMVLTAVRALAARADAMEAEEASRTEQLVAQLQGLRPAQKVLVQHKLLPSLRKKRSFHS